MNSAAFIGPRNAGHEMPQHFGKFAVVADPLVGQEPPGEDHRLSVVKRQGVHGYAHQLPG